MKYSSPGSCFCEPGRPGEAAVSQAQGASKLTDNDFTQTGPPSGLMNRTTG